MIIGLTGHMGSGKSTVVSILKNQGFKHISLLDMAREEAEKQNLKEIRENLMTTSKYLQGGYGVSTLARRVKEKIEAQVNKNWVIEEIQNPAEVIEFKKLPSFVLISLVVPYKTLVKRILERKQPGDPSDKKMILKKLNQERGRGEPPEGQQLDQCMFIMDFDFENIMPLNEVEGAFLKLYHHLKLHF